MNKNWIILALAITVILTLGVFVLPGFIHKDSDTSSNNSSQITSQETNISDNNAPTEGDDMNNFQSITMDEATKIFANKGDYIILDVRHADEYAAGHIPSAINYANEDISTDKIDVLKDLDQTIYVYCRSGRRSKEAASKLAAIGYTNIIECGGIIDYRGSLEQ